MTRKRFMKLLMSKGHSRNSAAKLSRTVKMAGGSVSYGRVYKDIRKFSVFCDAIGDITNAVIEFSFSAKEAAETFSRLSASFQR